MEFATVACSPDDQREWCGSGARVAVLAVAAMTKESR
jgi:hypothetical protein